MSWMQRKPNHAVTAIVVLAIVFLGGALTHAGRMPLDWAHETGLLQESRLIPLESGSIALHHRDTAREALERLPEHELKAFYAGCSRQGIHRRLDGGEAMICSISYDVLLKKHFGGDFETLLAWSRAEAQTVQPSE